jgi:hypothetical protein
MPMRPAHWCLIIVCLAVAGSLGAAARASRQRPSASVPGAESSPASGAPPSKAPAPLEARPISRQAPRKASAPPRFVNDLERAVVQARIVPPAASPHYPGLELTADEAGQVAATRRIFFEELESARRFMTGGNEDRQAFRTALGKARDEYRANLAATLGEERARKLRSIILARGEAGARTELERQGPVSGASGQGLGSHERRQGR